MSAPTPVAAQGSLVNRAKAMLLQPNAEWRVIDAEPASVGSLYTGYVLILAAVHPLCFALRGLTGYRDIGLFAGFGAGWVIRAAVAMYIQNLIFPYLAALVIDALAPSFGAQKNQMQALKLTVYSSTAVWISGVFMLVPGLGSLLLLAGALYSAYTFFLGVPVMTKAPADRAIGYTIVSFIASIVVLFVVSMVIGAITGRGGWGYM